MPPKKDTDKHKTTWSGVKSSGNQFKGASSTGSWKAKTDRKPGGSAPFAPIGLKAIRTGPSSAARVPANNGSGSVMSAAKARDRLVPGTVRAGGSGYTGEKGSAPTPAARSAKMDATLKPKAAKKAPSTTAKPYVKKGVPDYNRDVGAFYLNATQHMFSDKAGGKKKR